MGREGAVGEYEADFAVRSEVVDHVLDPGVVGVAGGREAEFPAHVVHELFAAPRMVVKRGIGEDEVGLERGMEVIGKGIVVVGGGEPEHYELLGEKKLRPIVNVEPTRESVFRALESLVLHPEKVDEMKRESVIYVRRHYDFVQVAQQYERLYHSIMERSVK